MRGDSGGRDVGLNREEDAGKREHSAINLHRIVELNSLLNNLHKLASNVEECVATAVGET